MRRFQLAALVCVVTAGLAACSTVTPARSGAPPLKFCGQTLWDGAAGAVPTNATHSGDVTAVLTSDQAAFVELTSDCDQGATITLEHAGSAVVVRRFRARSTGLVAVEVRPGKTRSTIVVTRAANSRTIVYVPRS